MNQTPKTAMRTLVPILLAILSLGLLPAARLRAQDAPAPARAAARPGLAFDGVPVKRVLQAYADLAGKTVITHSPRAPKADISLEPGADTPPSLDARLDAIRGALAEKGIAILPANENTLCAVPLGVEPELLKAPPRNRSATARGLPGPSIMDEFKFGETPSDRMLQTYMDLAQKTLLLHAPQTPETNITLSVAAGGQHLSLDDKLFAIRLALKQNGVDLVSINENTLCAVPAGTLPEALLLPERRVFNAVAPDSAPPANQSRFDPETPEKWPLPFQNLDAIDKLLKLETTNAAYRERLEKRRAELAAERAAHGDTIDHAAEERAAEAFVRMMRHANLENLREGGKGLGIPLTPEEEALLQKLATPKNNTP